MIRPATRADIPEIVDLGERHWGESRYGQWMAADRQTMVALARGLMALPNALVLVDERDERLVGTIGVIITPHIYCGQGVMSELFLYVDPDKRGNGVRLVRRAEKWAADQGIRHSTMTAPDERVAALYERMGYAPLEVNYIKTLF